MSKDLSTYLDRVTSAHSDKPKFMATLAATLQPFVDAQALLTALPSYFDLDIAIGVQLDAVGEWINLSRNVSLPVPDPWFRFDDDGTRGWDKGVWKQPFDTGSFITGLDDETYRRLLRARVLANHWDGTVPSAMAILQTFFTDPAVLMFADDKMTNEIAFVIAGKVPDPVTLELFSGGYLPLSAAGVRTHFWVTSIPNTPVFGFDVSNDHVAGWDAGSWAVDAQIIIANLPPP